MEMAATTTQQPATIPVHQGVWEELAKFRGGKAYFVPLAGNHGDKLIELGCREAIAAQELQLVEDRARADVILINGGAKLAHEHLTMLGPSSQRYPNIPLIAMPSTYQINDQDFADCFAGRTSPAVVFARERYSFEAISGVKYSTDVRCRLDHDMAFALWKTPLIEGLRARSREGHVLVVERFDAENSTVPARTVPEGIKKWVPSFIARPIKKWRHRRHAERSGFENTILGRVLQEQPQCKSLPVISQDVSRGDLLAFEEFLSCVANAAVVVTTRLHVGILAMMLGKKTYIKGGTGGYKKIQGVYEYSMAGSGQVKLF